MRDKVEFQLPKFKKIKFCKNKERSVLFESK